MDATLKLVARDTKGAASTTILLLRIMSPTADEPSLGAHLSRIATCAKACRVLEDTLRVGTLDDETLRRLDAEFASFLASYTLKWSLWAVRAWYIMMRDYVRSTGGIRATIASVATGDSPTQTAAGFGWLIDAQEDPAKLLQALSRFYASSARRGAGPMSIRMVARLEGSVVLHVNGLVRVHATRIAIAAERFRLSQGTLPESLDELVPEHLSEIPSDPFDDSQMKLARTDAGIVIYSVGSDKYDDGGSVEGRRPPDVGFRLFNLDQRGVKFFDPPQTEDD